MTCWEGSDLGDSHSSLICLFHHLIWTVIPLGLCRLLRFIRTRRRREGPSKQEQYQENWYCSCFQEQCDLLGYVLVVIKIQVLLQSPKQSLKNIPMTSTSFGFGCQCCIAGRLPPNSDLMHSLICRCFLHNMERNTAEKNKCLSFFESV